MPPGSPENTTVEDIGSTFATLAWDKPANPGHPELYVYEVVYRRLNNGGIKLLEATTTAINITSLAVGVRYSVAVRARSTMFIGNLSVSVVFRTNFTGELVNN